MSGHKQLLDPLGTICKLITLNFCEIKTKMSIHNHILYLQKPDRTQFLIRYLHGDDRENISEIYYIINQIIKWYFTDGDYNNNASEIGKSAEFRRIIKYTIIALQKLQETYEYGNAILAIQFYINILNDSLNSLFTQNKLPNYIIQTEYQNLLDYDKLKNFWDYKKLKRICELYDSCFKIYHDTEIAPPEKSVLIEGNIRAVNSLLELTDSEFQKLILNSNKG